jgi:hypothetical protein
MWGTVLILAAMAAPDPVRLGVVLLLLSRKRPLPYLLAYWLGTSAMVLGLLLVLVLLRDFASAISLHVAAAAASSTARHIQVVVGLLALLIAVAIAKGISLRQQARLLLTGGGPSTLLVQQSEPATLLLQQGDPATLLVQQSEPATFSPLLSRVQDLLASGRLWVAFGAGLGTGPPPVECLVALTAIAISKASIGSQFGAAAVYIVVMLALIEIPLISYLARPRQTEAAMLKLGEVLRVHRRRIFAVIIAVAGACLMAGGLVSA